MRKGLVSLILAVIVLCMVLPQIPLEVGAIKADLAIIHDPAQLSGKDYSAAYADKLDKIFRGTAPLFSNTKTEYPVGSSLNINKTYNVADAISGKQCYIYSQAVYYYLFGDIPFKGDGYKYWSDSKKIITNEPEFSYELFAKAGVGFGAYIRTTKNSDGSYNGNIGHSMIVLKYDKSSITYIDCNQDGKGKIQVQKRSWENFNAEEIVRKGRRISHVIQCMSAVCTHTDAFGNATLTDFNGESGRCTECNYIFDWEGTFTSTSAGTYTVYKKFTPKTDKPYKAGADADFYILNDAQIEVLGTYTNAYGEKWYKILFDGVQYYAPQNCMSFESADLDVSCTDFAPANNADIQKKPYSLKGLITSNYPLKTIEAYVDGKIAAIWIAPDQSTMQIDLQNTTIDAGMKFAAYETGKHTITLKANAHNGTSQEFLVSVFYTVEKLCSHSYSYQVTQVPTVSEAGNLSATCSKCSVIKEIILPKLSDEEYTCEVEKAVTCTQNGKSTYTWKNLDYGTFSFDVVTKAGGHCYIANETAPTCTKPGYTTYTCACGYSYVGNHRGELSHQYDYTVVKAPSALVDGELCGTCTRCALKSTITLPNLNYTDYVYEQEKAPTCTENGFVRYTWQTMIYGKIVFDIEIAATGHDYTDRLMPPTCTEVGYMTHTCACGYSYQDSYKEALEHKFEDGKCSRCGQSATQEQPEAGDLNNDYLLNDADVLYLLYAIFDPEGYPLLEFVDYNNDGVLSDADAVYLLYSIFDPEGYPLK